MRVTATVTMILMMAAPAHAQAPEDVAHAFGYAIQAMSWCDGLMVRVDTEERLEAELGQPLRGDGASLNDAFGAGLNRFFEDQAEHGDDEACALAYDRVGPTGSEYPGLLFEL